MNVKDALERLLFKLQLGRDLKVSLSEVLDEIDEWEAQEEKFQKQAYNEAFSDKFYGD